MTLTFQNSKMPVVLDCSYFIARNLRHLASPHRRSRLLRSPYLKSCNDCRKKCGKGKVPMEILLEMEEAFDKMESSQSNSLLKKHLKRDVFDMLKGIQTPMGATLLDCIRSGLENLDSSVGIYAADKDAYDVYKELFDPIIEDYHSVKKGIRHPKVNWGDPNSLPKLDPEGKYIISTRVRCGRSVEGFPFSSRMSEQDYLNLEEKVSMAVNSLQGELQGTYYPLKLMTNSERDKLIDDHYLYKMEDKYLEAANAMRFWPKGRGIFYNPKKTFLVWVGEEDHIRLISMENSGDVRQVYKRLKDAAQQLEEVIQFSRSDRLGYLTFCVTNLGTSIRASVHIRLPRLSKNKAKLDEIAARHNLQVRGTAGEHSESLENVYDLSNKRRLGLTEFEALKEMCDGIQQIIKVEET